LREKVLDMSTFVLVPGAGPVAPLLRHAGHAVHTAAADPDAVARILEERDLDDVVLVAHAEAGRAIGAAARRAPRRVAQLVYLDADADAAPAPARRTYVHCTRTGTQPRVRFGDPGWEVTDLPAGARPLDEAPDLVATLLHALAAQSEDGGASVTVAGARAA
jgi:pimeloyl-ACP methyl ester carboxylesterase